MTPHFNAQAQGYNLAKFKHRVVVLPPNSPCRWAGMGMQACYPGSRCVAWVKGDLSRMPLDTIMHELGHNLNLQHAQQGNNDYGVWMESCILHSAVSVVVWWGHCSACGRCWEWFGGYHAFGWLICFVRKSCPDGLNVQMDARTTSSYV